MSIHDLLRGPPAPSVRTPPEPSELASGESARFSIVTRPRIRRSVRRAVRTSCQAVAVDGFRLLGDRVLDLSTRGMLVACDTNVDIGEDVIVSFRAPNGGPFIDAEASIARVVAGWRPWDPGYCVGLRFTRLESAARNELLVRLAGLPPPVPSRPLRRDYAETVRRIWAS